MWVYSNLKYVHLIDTLSGGSSNQQIIHSASPPLDQTTAGSGVDQHDLNFMSESST